MKKDLNSDLDASKVDLIDFILFPIFVAAFFSVLVVFHCFQLIALLIGRKAHDSVIHGLNFWLVRALKVIGVNLELQLEVALTPGKSYIFVSNHQSMYDIPILFRAFPSVHPRFIAKKELGRGIPSVSLNLRRGWNVLIDRENPKQAIKAIRDFAQLANEQRLSVVLFPEGTRGKDGNMKDFRVSGFKALWENMDNPQLVLVTLDGSWKLATRPPIHRGVKVVVRAKQMQLEGSAKEVLSQLHTECQHELSRIREA